MRFLFYSHDGCGLGHTCRNLAIARALIQRAPGCTVLLASGSDDVTRLGVPAGVDILKLPGLRKLANERYGARHLALADGDVRHLRQRLLASTVESFRPDVLLVDKHPFGAGGELKEALAALRRLGGSAVLGLRDILDEPATVRREWEPHQLPQIIPRHYDSVLVYGQAGVFDSAAAYDFSAELRQRTRYCGYVANHSSGSDGHAAVHAPAPPADTRHPFILATVGGGEDGFKLLENFLGASRGNGWRPVAVSGPLMPERQHKRLESLAGEFGVELHSFVPGLNQWFANAGAVVCMGGYNTLTQALAAGSPVVCVPRVKPRREQLLRAQAFAQRNLLCLLKPAELSPNRLRAEIQTALATPRAQLRARIRAAVHFDGAQTAADHLLSLAAASRVSCRERSPLLAPSL